MQDLSKIRDINCPSIQRFPSVSHGCSPNDYFDWIPWKNIHALFDAIVLFPITKKIDYTNKGECMCLI